MHLQPGWRFCQCILVFFLATVFLVAQPATTRIFDTVYLANGDKFNGHIQIEWQSFVSSEAPIAPQSKLVRVIDGVLDVSLVSTTTVGYTAYYRVRYFRNGRVQYIEYWDVPPSASPLAIAAVRLTAPPTVNQVTGTGISLPIAQEYIEGLSTDLADRPVKGPNFVPSRTVFVNPEGALEAIAGSPTDCVRVDGTAVPCGSAESSNYPVDGEVPSGTVNGLNQVFGLSGVPAPPASLQIYRNGILQKQETDYTLSGSVLSFSIDAIPQPGDIVLAYYRTFQTTAVPLNGSGTLPHVVCSLPGSSTNLTSLSTLGTCTLSDGLLRAGDRLEVQFDYALTGASSDSYDVQLLFGGTPLLTRTFTATDSRSSGIVRVAVGSTVRQFSAQSLGVLSPAQFAAGSVTLPTGSFQVELRGKVTANQAAQLTLTAFTITRYPKVTGQ